MRWPIRNQILLPFAALLAAALGATAAVSAYSAATRAEAATVAQVNRLIAALDSPSYPFTENVLRMMRGLSGAEFVAFDADGRRLAGTIPLDRLPAAVLPSPSGAELAGLSGVPAVSIAGEPHLAAALRRTDPFGRAVVLLVLYPEADLRRTRAAAATPPLVVGGIALLLAGPVAAWLSGRMSRRLGSVRRQVAAIADGDFRPIPPTGPDDEIAALVASVNRMAERLRDLEAATRSAERSSLLGQLAGGLAHTLRNAATGARMAVQLHQKRLPSEVDGRESLAVALRQLELIEEQIKGLLALGRGEPMRETAAPLAEVLAEVARLAGPAASHARVALAIGDSPAGVNVPDAAGLRTATLNLVLNAIEAAGPGGSVSVQTSGGRRSRESRAESPETHSSTSLDSRFSTLVLTVTDTGPGPAAEVADRLFEPFVTTKPEGAGFGLAVVRRFADRHGGTVDWSRDAGRTTFQMIFPVSEQASDVELDAERPSAVAGH